MKSLINKVKCPLGDRSVSEVDSLQMKIDFNVGF